MDYTDGTVNEGEFGKLVLRAIPTKETEELVIFYLSRIVKMFLLKNWPKRSRLRHVFSVKISLLKTVKKLHKI